VGTFCAAASPPQGKPIRPQGPILFAVLLLLLVLLLARCEHLLQDILLLLLIRLVQIEHHFFVERGLRDVLAAGHD
jgi:hypothetical protein